MFPRTCPRTSPRTSLASLLAPFVLVTIAGLSVACVDAPAPTPTGPDAGTEPETDPLAGIAEATREPFHLIVDGTASDGRPRLIYMPKTIWLATTTPFVDDLDLRLSRSDFLFRITGELTPFGRAGLTELRALSAAADAAGFHVVAGTRVVPQVVCGWANPDLIDLYTLSAGCNGEPAVKDWLSLPFSASTTTAIGDLDARIAPLLASGGAWDEILGGTITWHLPSGDTFVSKLEIGCVGAEKTPSDEQTLFRSTACQARYAP